MTLLCHNVRDAIEKWSRMVALQRIKQNQLRERIMEVIAQEFGSLDREGVATVLAQLLRQFDSEIHISVASEVLSSDSSPSVSRPREAGDDSSFGVVDSGSRINLVAADDEQIIDVLNQIVAVGAVLIQLDRTAELNDQIALHIELVPLQFTVDFVGRVVNISPAGTAIEVSQITKEDRAALEQLHQQYKSKKATPEQKSAARRSDNEFGKAPLSGVNTPGLDARMARLSRTGNEPRFRIKRQVEMTLPDSGMVRELTRHRVKLPSNNETYGPKIKFATMTGEPDRIEQLVNDRIVDILLQQSKRDFSGVVEIERDDKSNYQLQFDSGFLTQIICEPRRAEFELGPMLLAANRLDKVQIDMAAAHAEEHGLPLERALHELNIMETDLLRNTLAGRLTFILADIVKINTGLVRVVDAESMTPGFLPMPPLRVHLAVERPIFASLFDKARMLSAQDRETRSADDLDAYPEINEVDRERLEQAIESEEHLRFVQNILTGQRRLREVFTESALAGPETFAIVFSLHRMGLLSFDRSLHHTVVRERFRENVTVKYLSVHKASYFEVLNVHWSSYDAVIQRAYDELCQQFDPNDVPEHMESEVHQRVKEIRERVESAYQVLAKRPHRHAYRTRIMPEYKLQHAVPLFLKQCELSEKRNQLEDAADALRRVLEIAPDHKDAQSWQDHLKLLDTSGDLLGNVDSSFL